MSQGPDPRRGQSSEYREQLIIEAIARSRYPGRGIKEILPGFSTDPHNYVWIVILADDKPFENTLTTVDSNNIRAWLEHQKEGGGLE
jgi:hypothetical protein